MGTLHFITALSMDSAKESDESFTLISFEAVREIKATNVPLSIKGSRRLDRDYITTHYSPWLVKTEILPAYDVFISHRWHKADHELIKQLCDTFFGRTIGPQKRAVQVFLDELCLPRGLQFQREYGKALINSTVVVPIFCTKALEKMMVHNSKEEDNVLIEWMLALESIQNRNSTKIYGIYPLMFGERKEDGTIGDLFAEGIIDRLPETIPTACIEVVKSLLEENGQKASDLLRSRTVRGVVTELKNYMGLKGWERTSNELTYTASEEIIDLIEKSLSSRDLKAVK